MKDRQLNERQWELLHWLDDQKWATPFELGGYNGSHHSGTLARLVIWGLAERQKKHAIYCASEISPNVERRCRCKGSCRYRRTPAGRAYNDAHPTRPDQ